MTRRNISLPDALDAEARDAGLNVSAIARRAIVDELDRHARMARLDAWLDELDGEHGQPSAKTMDVARKWAEQSIPVEPRSERAAPTGHISTTAAKPAKRPATTRRRAAS